jgi:serine/threonine-protein kinase
MSDRVTGDPRLPELFAQASELDAEARGRFLAELAATDAALAGEVEELLASVTAGERRFAAFAVDRLHDGPDAQPPARIGPYRVVREIGRGGMGRVFLAEQEGAEFHRTVALKVIDRPRARARHCGASATRCASSLASSTRHRALLRHRRAEDGIAYLVLEYVEGEDLLAYVRSHGLGLRARVELFLPVVDAVDFAHRRLVVHRDLKPGNVVIGGDGQPRLLDFGISKVLDPATEGRRRPAPGLPRSPRRTRARSRCAASR